MINTKKGNLCTELAYFKKKKTQTNNNVVDITLLSVTFYGLLPFSSSSLLLDSINQFPKQLFLSHKTSEVFTRKISPHYNLV